MSQFVLMPSFDMNSLKITVVIAAFVGAAAPVWADAAARTGTITCQDFLWGPTTKPRIVGTIQWGSSGAVSAKLKFNFKYGQQKPIDGSATLSMPLDTMSKAPPQFGDQACPDTSSSDQPKTYWDVANSKSYLPYIYFDPTIPVSDGLDPQWQKKVAKVIASSKNDLVISELRIFFPVSWKSARSAAFVEYEAMDPDLHRYVTYSDILMCDFDGK